jgi:hypothetical protein
MQSARIEITNQYFQRMDLLPYTQERRETTVKGYRQELLDGIHNQGRLPMSGTGIETIDLQSPRLGQLVLSTDIGGTNRYATVEQVTEKGFERHAFIKEPFESRVFPDAKTFFNTVADTIVKASSALKGRSPDALAVVYSFPGEGKRTSYGIDVTPTWLTKEFVIPGIQEEPVGLALVRVLKERMTIAANTPVLVANDTPTVMGSIVDADMGLVDATGYNIAGRFNKKVRSTESGNSGAAVMNGLALKYDEASENKGINLAEKEIAGDPVRVQYNYGVKDLIGLKALRGLGLRGEISSGSISKLLDGDFSGLVTDGLTGDIDITNAAILIDLAKRLSERSSSLVAIHLGTIIDTFPSDYAHSPVKIPAEGTFMWSMPGYSDDIKDRVYSNTKRDIDLMNIPNAGLDGAKRLALSLT